MKINININIQFCDSSRSMHTHAVYAPLLMRFVIAILNISALWYKRCAIIKLYDCLYLNYPLSFYLTFLFVVQIINYIYIQQPASAIYFAYVVALRRSPRRPCYCYTYIYIYNTHRRLSLPSRFSGSVILKR
jgi:hypothetical protein